MHLFSPKFILFAKLFLHQNFVPICLYALATKYSLLPSNVAKGETVEKQKRYSDPFVVLLVVA